jgi:hypothetical protein
MLERMAGHIVAVSSVGGKKGRRRKPEVFVPWLSAKTLSLVNFFSVRLADWLILKLRLGGEEIEA